MFNICEYIWMDGATPTQKLRSKARVLKLKSFDKLQLSDFPEWGFDGSSTWQAPGNDSDLALKTCSFCKGCCSRRQSLSCYV